MTIPDYLLAGPKDQEGGWTIDRIYLAKIERIVERQYGESPGLEEIEAVILVHERLSALRGGKEGPDS